MPRPPQRPASSPLPPGGATPIDLSLHELDELQDLLDRVPAPLEPLDTSMVDGFLCGVLVQPTMVPPARWLPFITDIEGHALPAGFDARRLHELVLRRHRVLDAAIARRAWFDPWVFELDDDDEDDPVTAHGGQSDDDDGAPGETDAVFPWVAGMSAALEVFPQLSRSGHEALTEPFALLFRHVHPDDLEDAEDLLEEIESLEPPADLAEAVEGLVRATLLLADIGRPLAPASGHGGGRRPPRGAGARRR
jgi:uncharacterized protein